LKYLVLHETLEVIVVSELLDQVLGDFQVMAPMLAYFNDYKQLLVTY
jgi:hypothetical protein